MDSDMDPGKFIASMNAALPIGIRMERAERFE
jgi:hypothetical protein